MSTKYHIIPIFVPHIGCPHDCIFCNQRKIAIEKANIEENSIRKIIDSYLSTIPTTNEKLEIAFFGGSFTGIDIDIQKKLLKIAYDYKKKGIVDRIRLSTRPDYIDKERLELLKQFGVDIIELGVQSMSSDVLKNSFRGHTALDVVNASNLIKDYGFKLGLQMMVGLPSSDYNKELFTAKQIISLKPSIVRIYPTLVIKDTYLEKEFYTGKFNPLSLEDAVYICTDLLMLFNYYGVNVIRIGLQPTDNIAANKDIVVGPFHPAFRQLVEEKIYRIFLQMFFDSISKISNDIQVHINKKEISNFVGQSSSNLKYLHESYGLSKVKIRGEDISKRLFYIESKDMRYEIDIKEYTVRYLIDKGLIVIK